MKSFLMPRPQSEDEELSLTLFSIIIQSNAPNNMHRRTVIYVSMCRVLLPYIQKLRRKGTYVFFLEQM